MTGGRIEVKIGDKVLIGKEHQPLKIREILEEVVQIGGEKVTLKRLYFQEKHQPEFDWRVKKIVTEIKL